MNNIKKLKSELNRKRNLLPAQLDDAALEEVDKLILNNPLLEHYINMMMKKNFIQGMNQASIILFEESIEEL